jgi:hypothetical protein
VSELLYVPLSSCTFLLVSQHRWYSADYDRSATTKISGLGFWLSPVGGRLWAGSAGPS